MPALRSPLCLVLVLGALLPALPAAAQGIIEYRTASGEVGFAQDASSVPPGATIVDTRASGKPILVEERPPPRVAVPPRPDPPQPERQRAPRLEPERRRRECTPRPTGRFENGAPVIDVVCRMVETDDEPPEFDAEAWAERREERREAARQRAEQERDEDWDEEDDDEEQARPRRSSRPVTGPGGRPVVEPRIR